MKRNNKKGFTIVELVIVIAVIAILSAVLIPTFGSVINDANNVSRDQEAKNLFTEYLIGHQGTSGDGWVKVTQSGTDYYYQVTNNQIDLANEKTSATQGFSVPGTHIICNTSTCTSCHPADGAEG